MIETGITRRFKSEDAIKLQVEVQCLEALLKDQEEVIRNYVEEVDKLETQLAKFKDCVPVPKDVYDEVLYRVGAELKMYSSGVNKIKQFLKLKDGL